MCRNLKIKKMKSCKITVRMYSRRKAHSWKRVVWTETSIHVYFLTVFCTYSSTGFALFLSSQCFRFFRWNINGLLQHRSYLWQCQLHLYHGKLKKRNDSLLIDLIRFLPTFNLAFSKPKCGSMLCFENLIES